MRAMLLKDLGPVIGGSSPLESADWPDPTPLADEILIRVSVCGVCDTELDEVEGWMPQRLPDIADINQNRRVRVLLPGFRDPSQSRGRRIRAGRDKSDPG